jgi:hypothetical protein
MVLDQQLRFGRDRVVDVRFPEESRLSRLAGTIRAVQDGVVVTNLSATHDIHVRTVTEILRLSPRTADQPVASVLLGGGTAAVTWPGSRTSSIGITQHVSPGTGIAITRTLTGCATFLPLTLNEATKEFAVALFLCLPRLRGVPGETATPSVPELTRQILLGTNSFHLVQAFDGSRDTRTKLANRTHEHLKSLRDKLIQAQLAPQGAALSPESIADLLVDHNVLTVRHTELLGDGEWLTQQERNWER